MDYKQAWDLQEKFHAQIVAGKLACRDRTAGSSLPPSLSYLLLCEHPPVYTLGKSGKEEHLLANPEFLKNIGASYYRNNRGGDITYHGPGQLVGYPLLDLDNFFTDIHRYMRTLEETIIRTLMDFNISSGRIDGLTGVWLDPDRPSGARKICALGVRCSHWVTMHGFALNVNTDLSYFSHIVPCGIPGKPVTSMQKELRQNVPMEEVKQSYLRHFSDVFQAEITPSVLLQEEALDR